MKSTRINCASRQLGWALIGLLLLFNGGCLWVAAGAAAAGGAATASWFYIKGEAYHDYQVSQDQAHAAVLAGLAEMQLQVLRRDIQNELGRKVIETRLADGTIAKITLASVGSAIPADGPVTRITVRVGTFGDETISGRMLATIGKFLPAPAPMPVPLAQRPEGPPPPLGAAVVPGTIQPVAVQGPPPPAGNPRSFETTAPPLAK